MDAQSAREMLAARLDSRPPRRVRRPRRSTRRRPRPRRRRRRDRRLPQLERRQEGPAGGRPRRLRAAEEEALGSAGTLRGFDSRRLHGFLQNRPVFGRKRKPDPVPAEAYVGGFCFSECAVGRGGQSPPQRFSPTFGPLSRSGRCMSRQGRSGGPPSAPRGGRRAARPARRRTEDRRSGVDGEVESL